MPLETFSCDCGKPGLTERTHKIHIKSKAHQEWVMMQEEEVSVEVLPVDLQTICDAVDMDPVERVRMLRAAFSHRGWPNNTHPITVREFCEQYAIPVIDPPRHLSAADTEKYIQEKKKELMYGRIEAES